MLRKGFEVRFFGSFTKNFPKDDKKHVVFVGRSNAGKSSLINMIVGKKIAYVSKEPGRTKTVNFFLFGRHVYFVDLPGYGYAKVPGREREKWKTVIEKYFSECKENIALVFLLMDGRIGPTSLDEFMVKFLEKQVGVPYVVVLTKWDKTSNKEQAFVLNKVKALTEVPIVLTSARENKGKEELLSYIPLR